MSEPKPFASLGPTLLARKGGARPAMRPQLAPLTGLGAPAEHGLSPDEALEDLGWNDMGVDVEDFRSSPLHQARVYSLTPAASASDEEIEIEAEAEAEAEAVSAELPAAAYEPEVVRQQRQVAAAVEDTIREPVRRRKASESARRAAFTLRLDASRHLKLRLASTIKNRSAQQLVTQALDQFLAEIPEIETLAAQVQRD